MTRYELRDEDIKHLRDNGFFIKVWRDIYDLDRVVLITGRDHYAEKEADR